MKKIILGLFIFAIFFHALNFAAFAHEVYVLDGATIEHEVTSPGPNPLSAIEDNLGMFVGAAAAICALLAVTIYFSTRLGPVKFFAPYLAFIKPYGLFIGRITLGLALVASAYYNSLFGPEIPLSSLFSHVFFVRIFLGIVGMMLLLGLFTRMAAAVSILFYFIAVAKHGVYMTTYLNYFGDMLVLVMLKGHVLSLDDKFKDIFAARTHWVHIFHHSPELSFLILRVFFGISLIFASFYAKFLHSGLGYQTITQYHLTHYFPFPPLFILLGAFLVESLLGMLFILGIEIRLTSIVLTIFLTLSIIYFRESVWPHIILYGTNFAIFAHGYDKYTLEGRWYKRKHEPVL